MAFIGVMLSFSAMLSFWALAFVGPREVDDASCCDHTVAQMLPINPVARRQAGQRREDGAAPRVRSRQDDCIPALRRQEFEDFAGRHPENA
jgi:hypothetical protein